MGTPQIYWEDRLLYSKILKLFWTIAKVTLPEGNYRFWYGIWFGTQNDSPQAQVLYLTIIQFFGLVLTVCLSGQQAHCNCPRSWTGRGTSDSQQPWWEAVVILPRSWALPLTSLGAEPTHAPDTSIPSGIHFPRFPAWSWDFIILLLYKIVSMSLYIIFLYPWSWDMMCVLAWIYSCSASGRRWVKFSWTFQRSGKDRHGFRCWWQPNRRAGAYCR